LAIAVQGGKGQKIGIFWLPNIFILLTELVLLTIIRVLYVSGYRRIRARSLIGILVFSGLFLLQSATGLFAYYHLSKNFGENLVVLLMGMNAMGLSAFISLFLSLKQ
jgi:hypothetical protein